MCTHAVARCVEAFGRFCWVPLGKNDTEGLKGRTGAGTLGPVTPLEVRFLSSDGGDDYCLPYGAASALHAFGDKKLHQQIVKAAAELEQKERQMEALRALATGQGWKAKVLVGEEARVFDPLAPTAR